MSKNVTKKKHFKQLKHLKMFDKKFFLIDNYYIKIENTKENSIDLQRRKICIFSIGLQLSHNCQKN